MKPDELLLIAIGLKMPGKLHVGGEKLPDLGNGQVSIPFGGVLQQHHTYG